MQTGTIVSLVMDRGFGFITAPGASDIFFHVNDLEGLEFDERLLERRVKFDVVNGDRGARAKNIQPAE